MLEWRSRAFKKYLKENLDNEKLLALLFAIMPIVANANIPFTKQDLIGKWECKFLIDKDFRSESVIEYRNDDTILYNLSENDDLYQGAEQ